MVSTQTNNRLNMDVEFGCGAGWHPVQWSKLNPKRHLIAIEPNNLRYGKLLRRIERNTVQNVSPIKSTTQFFYANNDCSELFDNIYILYPTPYLKNSMKNKRWARMDFAKNIVDSMKKNAQLHLATNKKQYAEEFIDYFKNEWNLSEIKNEYFNLEKFNEQNLKYRTHFEKKYLEAGETIFNAILSKDFK